MTNTQLHSFIEFLGSLTYYTQVAQLEHFIDYVNECFEHAGLNDTNFSFILDSNNLSIHINGFYGDGQYCLDDPDYMDRIVKTTITFK